MLTPRRTTYSLVLGIMVFLISCWGGGSREPAWLDSLRQDVAQLRSGLAELSRSEGGDGRFTLQLLHASDMDGSTGALQNVENFSAILSGFRDQLPDNTLVLSSGDNYIPGPRYYAAADTCHRAIVGSGRQRPGRHGSPQRDGFPGLGAGQPRTGSRNRRVRVNNRRRGRR